MVSPVSLFAVVQHPRFTIFALAPSTDAVPLGLAVHHPRGRRVCWAPETEGVRHNPADLASSLQTFIARHLPPDTPAILLTLDYAAIRPLSPPAMIWPCPVVQTQALADLFAVSPPESDAAPALLDWWLTVLQPGLPQNTTLYDLLRSV